MKKEPEEYIEFRIRIDGPARKAVVCCTVMIALWILALAGAGIGHFTK